MIVSYNYIHTDIDIHYSICVTTRPSGVFIGSWTYCKSTVSNLCSRTVKQSQSIKFPVLKQNNYFNLSSYTVDNTALKAAVQKRDGGKNISTVLVTFFNDPNKIQQNIT